ncbi:MAG TPA: DUF4167 domain-containing protein [Methylocella sp.]|nr:DUF4167 domain-containing protein [Methylocella sp.]
MRPAQNSKRMRGRPNNNRKGPNPLTRSFESSGPDVKIRGTAHHISEKYLQLARDAQAAGDPVMAESYLQHAEHYFRLIAAAQQAQQQGQSPYSRPGGEAFIDETEEDSDFGVLPDRFASPSERIFPSPQANPTSSSLPSSAQPVIERPYLENGERQMAERQPLPRSERGGRPERPFQHRSFRDREGANYSERPYAEQRTFAERNGRGREDEGRGRGRGARDYRGESPIRVEQGHEAKLADEGFESNGLPAFLTASVRVQPPEAHETEPAIETLSPLHNTSSNGQDAANGYHQRPRRRRRSKAELGFEEAQIAEVGNAGEPVQD